MNRQYFHIDIFPPKSTAYPGQLQVRQNLMLSSELTQMYFLSQCVRARFLHGKLRPTSFFFKSLISISFVGEHLTLRLQSKLSSTSNIAVFKRSRRNLTKKMELEENCEEKRKDGAKKQEQKLQFKLVTRKISK